MRPNDPLPAVQLIDRSAAPPTVWPMVVSLFRYRELLRNLVLKDLKLKYRGSVLGFLWSLANPLAMMGVYTLAFDYILRVGQPGFPFFVLLGLLAWTFFASSATMSTTTIIDGGSLVKAVRFPRAILPIATVLFNLTQYLLSVLVLLPVMFLLYRVPPSGPMLLFPIFLALQLAFTTGVALMLSLATATYRDVRHFVDIALWLLFWTTPIVYSLSMVPEEARPYIAATPMSPFILAYQRIFYEGAWPDARTWALAVTYGIGMLALGAWWFRSREDRLGEQL